MPTISARTLIECPADTVAALLACQPADWLQPFLRIAGAEGEMTATVLRASPRSEPRGITIRKTVAVSLGEPQPIPRSPAAARDGDGSAGAVAIPVQWEAIGFRALFPVFDGRFVVRPAPRGRTAVTLTGFYDPPGGPFGEVVDRLVARRVARATLRALLRDLRTALEQATVDNEATVDKPSDT